MNEFAGRLLARAVLFTQRWRRVPAIEPASAARAAGIAGRLVAQRDALIQLSRAMGPEFVDLTGALREVNECATELAGYSRRLIAITSSSEELSSVTVSFQLMKKAEDLVRASYQQFDAIFEVFRELDRGLSAASSEEQSLARALIPLQFVTTLFRVQACAFPPDVRDRFFTLADDISSLGDDVKRAVAVSFEGLAQTKRASAMLVSEVSGRVQQHRSEIDAALNSTRTLLQRLGDSFQVSDETARSLEIVSAAIPGCVSRVVLALQCEDMARQKLEHLAAAIDEIDRRLRDDAAADGERFAFAAQASAVQAAQLEALFVQLDKAAEDISGGMQGMQSHSQCIAQAALRSGVAEVDGQTMHRSVESMHDILAIIDATLERTRGILVSIAPLKERLSDCTAKMLGLALHLRLVALNAQVFAAQLEDGVALEELAAQTRRVCDSSLESLDRIHDRVDSLAGMVTALEDGLRDFVELGAVEHRVLDEEAAATKRRLEESHAGLLDCSRAIVPAEQRLAAAAESALGRMRFPAAVREAKERSIAEFRRVIEECEAFAGPCLAAAPPPGLEALAQNYTMHQERVIHSASLGGLAQAIEETEAAPQPAPTNEEDLGDNVELF